MPKSCPLFSVDFILKICHQPTVEYIFGDMATFKQCLEQLVRGERFSLKVTYRDEADRLIHEAFLRQIGLIFRGKIHFSITPASPTSDRQHFFYFWNFWPVADLSTQVAA